MLLPIPHSAFLYTSFSFVTRRLNIFTIMSWFSGTVVLGRKAFFARECRMYEQIVLPYAAGTQPARQPHPQRSPYTGMQR